MKKRGQKRKNTRYPGLERSVNAKTRHDLIDHDYIHKLNDKEKQWLSNFNEEWISGNFHHEGNLVLKPSEENIEEMKLSNEHLSEKLVEKEINVLLKRESYNRNNARNRCIYTINKATNYLGSLDDYKEILDPTDIDDILEERLGFPEDY